MYCYNNEIDIQFNENNEPLFWKVFNNKYLIHLIFQQIESINLNSKKKTIKFKDIKSFKWMYKNQENELLKCKLEAGESITDIDKESLSGLFRVLFVKKFYKYHFKPHQNYLKEAGSYKMGDEYKEDTEKIEQDNKRRKKFELKLSNYKKSLDLLVKFKPDQLIQLEVVGVIIELGGLVKNLKKTLEMNEFIQKLLSMGPFNNSKELFSSNSIETAIRYISPCILETLLNHCKKVNNSEQIITEEIKNKSIILSNKSNFKNEMFEFILNEPKLFNSQPPSTLSLDNENNNENNNNENNNKRLKISKSKSLHSEIINDNTYKIGITDFILVKSSSIQILLLQNNFVKLDNYSKLSNESKKQLLELLNGIQNDKSLDEMEKRIKSIYLIRLEENSSCGQYFIKYGQINEKMDDLSVWSNTMELKSGIGLKHLLSKDKKQLVQFSIKRRCQTLYSKKRDEPFSISSETNEFIKYYTTGYHYFNYRQYDEQLLHLAISCDQKDYEQLLESIVVTPKNDKFTSLLLLRKSIGGSFNFQGIKDSKSFIIKDTETIDLLSNCLDTFIHFINQIVAKNNKLFTHFKFETYQLIDYARSKYGSLFFGKYKFDLFFNYPFTRAINNCDIESLKHIDQIGTKFDKFQGCKSIDDKIYSVVVLEKIKQVKRFREFSDKIKINFNYKSGVECKENVIELLNYLNGTDYKLFSLNLFKKFINDISRLEFIDKSILKSIKFPTHFNQSDSLELLLESISNNQVSSSKVIQLIIENFSPLSMELSSIKPIIEKWESGHNGLFDQSHYKYLNYVGEFEVFPQSSIYFVEDDNKEMYICESYQSIPAIIKSIELILNQFSINYKNNKGDGLNLMVSKLINYLYKRLIKVANLTIEQVLSNYQYINSTWKSITGLDFQFQHSLYHVFFYLSIKSKQLIDLIFDCEQLTENVDMSGNYWFDNEAYNYEVDGFYEGDNINEVGEDLSIVRALKPEIFTLDFIFNSTFKQVFDELKNILNQANGGSGDEDEEDE